MVGSSMFRPLSFILFSSLCSLCLCGKTSAALEPELKTPYQVRVVLQVAEHRMLTPLFQEELESELRSQLRLMLGKLANIEVVRSHPLLNDIRTKGLRTVLDTWDNISHTATHFVLVDYVDSQYQIQTAHHEGMTGLSGPVIRREVLNDRQRVPDTAAQLVRKDFGVVGTFQKLQGKEIELAIKGGELVESLTPWVKKGDVFSIVRLSTEGGKMRSVPIEWAVLQVTEIMPAGRIRCRYSCRYQEDKTLLEGGPGSGYRCVQLTTTRGPVRVRLVDDKTHEFLSGLRILVAPRDDFKGKPESLTTFNGLFETQQQFSHVAFIRVQSGEMPLAEFPVPLVDDRTIVCRMSPNPAAEKQGDLERRKGRWVRSVLDALAVAEKGLGEFNASLTPNTLENALKLGRQHQIALGAEKKRILAEHEELEKLAKTQKAKIDLTAGIELVGRLATCQQQLDKYLDDLDKLIKEANSDHRRELIATIKRAELLEKQAEFDKAIELYESVLKSGESAQVKIHLDQLKTAWTIKNKEHASARQFIYETWPSLDLTALAANIAKASESFQACKDAGDYLTPRKLSLVNIQHATALVKELHVLNSAPDNLDNRVRQKTMTQFASQLRALQASVEAWVAGDKASAK
jgi:tetratricopeptide (TPR) repeat protein